MVKGTLTRVAPRGMAYTLPPSCLSHPATIRPACVGWCGVGGGVGWGGGRVCAADATVKGAHAGRG